MKKSLHVVAILAVGLITHFSAGETVILSDSHRGFVGDGGGGLVDEGSFGVGETGVSPFLEARNFLTFDLEITGLIESATLRLFNLGFVSNDPTETYTLFDVDTPLPQLLNPNFMGDETFIDLGTGVSYGDVVVSDADDNSFVEIELNVAAIADMNAALGETFAIGGAITTLDGDVTTAEFMFPPLGGNPPVELVLTVVPAPGAIPVLGLAVLVPGRRRRDAAPLPSMG